MKGDGNSYDFGARMYDPRVGRWFSVDPLYALQPGWSPYKYALNNPLVFIDPDGETEFYFNGRWIGTDGVDNNVVAKVKDSNIKRQIIRSTKKGLNFQPQSISKAAEEKSGMLLINKDVLNYSNEMLILSFGEKGMIGEYGNTMEKDGNNYKPTGGMRYEKGDGVILPTTGDVSIHSHPTGEVKNKKGESLFYSASSPSKGSGDSDENAFKNFETNIIVGKNGNISSGIDEEGNKVYDESSRYSAINIFDKNSKLVEEIDGREASKMLSSERGRLGKRFEKKRNPDN